MNKIIATGFALLGLLGIVATAHATSERTAIIASHATSAASVAVAATEATSERVVTIPTVVITAPARHRVIVHPGTFRIWTCGAEQVSMVGGTYRACEWISQ